MTITTDYVEAIVRRAQEPMEPLAFEPNWTDRPYRTKYFPGAPRIALPPAAPESSMLCLGDLLTATTADRLVDLEFLSVLLRYSYGLLSRRLTPTGNGDGAGMAWGKNAVWARGAASGGGLYSAEIYWVAGACGPVLPGIYHYSPEHHAMERLHLGDASAQVRGALHDASPTDQYLLVSVKFWKNSFKYNSFAYHVVTMDVGTLLGTWGLLATSAGRTLRPQLWFDEAALNSTLGFAGTDESVFAVLPLPWAAAKASPTIGAGSISLSAREVEKSRNVIRFPRIEAVQRECLAEGLTPPPAQRVASSGLPAPSGGTSITLPPPTSKPLAAKVIDSLRKRRSSFGGLTTLPPLSMEDLAAILAFASSASRLGFGPRGTPHLTRLAVFANHVNDLPVGAYDYLADEHSLRANSLGSVGQFLQENYFLRNYNLDQAAATIAVVGNPTATIDALGQRGYRLLNTEVGATAQALYVVAAAHDRGCGAVLGFDNVSIADRLGMTGTGEWPLLLVMVGGDRPMAPNFDFRID